jgi:hypothetical protein
MLQLCLMMSPDHSADHSPDHYLLAMLQVRPPVVSPAYTARGGRSTFFVNTSLLGFADAEASCRANGGHLATFQVRICLSA